MYPLAISNILFMQHVSVTLIWVLSCVDYISLAPLLSVGTSKNCLQDIHFTQTQFLVHRGRNLAKYFCHHITCKHSSLNTNCTGNIKITPSCFTGPNKDTKTVLYYCTDQPRHPTPCSEILSKH